MKKQIIHNSQLKYLLPVFAVSLLVLGGTLYQQQVGIVGRTAYSSNVLGAKSEIAEAAEEREKTEEVEPVETPEPEEVDEAEEQEAADIHDEIENEVKQERVETVELEPPSEKQEKGTLKVEKTDGSSNEKKVSESSTPLMQVQNAQGGEVSISVGKNGTVTLVNNGVSVTTNYPVVIDPKSKTVAIRTPSGVTVINTLPSQALDGVGAADKPTTIQSAVLGAQDGQAYYEVTGPQNRKFLGMIPVSAQVQTKINADTGSLSSVNRPWFFNFFGFLYTV